MAPKPSSPELSVDVLVIGGGLVGGTLACALVEGGFEVAVVDVMDPGAGLDLGFDGRASALALGSVRLLQGVGLWDGMAAEASAIRDIRVTDGKVSTGSERGRTSPLFLHYDHDDVGQDAFGYMMENRFYRKALFDRMKGLKGLQIMAPAKVIDLDRQARGVTARLEDGRVIKASLVVGAEGRRSKTRDDAGIKLTGWSYNQTGIVCTVEHERSHDNIAHEHFLPSGPFAILPLNNNRASLVWTEKSDLAPHLMTLDNDDFLFELKRRFGDFLGEVKVVGPRFSYPLSLQYAETITATRLALAGDAAHGMHPIAGQGLNMGLRDVAALAEVLVDARRTGQDIGSDVVMKRYEQWRRFDNTLMLALTDALNRLFSNDFTPVRIARDIGLAAVNSLPPLKKVFMRHAMGLEGDLPRLMKGESL